MKKYFKSIAIFVLALVIAMTAIGCAKDTGTTSADDSTNAPTEAPKITITVDVVKSDKSEKTFTIETAADNLEDALVTEGLVSGEESEYGLYITTVDGEVANYDENKSFWNILKDEEILNTGAKDTKIADGEHYQLVYTIME